MSITVIAAYLPPVLGEFTDSTAAIAAVIAAEGAFAIALPLVIGPWSDTFHMDRRPFMIVALPLMAFCLVLVAFMPSFWLTAIVVFAFFIAYYLYEPPYRALPRSAAALGVRAARRVQHAFRGLALGVGPRRGGFLFHAWDPAPFLLAAGLTTAACGACIALVRERGGATRVFFKGVRVLADESAIVRAERDVRRFLIANAAEEASPRRGRSSSSTSPLAWASRGAWRRPS